jgi:transposase
LKNYNYDVKKAVVNQMLSGQSPEEAIQFSDEVVSKRSAYRWLADYHEQGDAGLQKKRGGVIWKFTDEMRERLSSHCQADLKISTPQLQALLLQEFDVELSLSHINQVRIDLGLSVRQLKKKKE